MKIGKRNIHFHSMSVHFTNSLYIVGFWFLILFKILHKESFQTTYYHLLILASFSAPVSYITGYIEWKQKYHGAQVKLFIHKVRYGIVLLVLGSFCAFWLFLNPAIISSSSFSHYVFIVLNLIIVSLIF